MSRLLCSGQYSENDDVPLFGYFDRLFLFRTILFVMRHFMIDCVNLVLNGICNHFYRMLFGFKDSLFGSFVIVALLVMGIVVLLACSTSTSITKK